MLPSHLLTILDKDDIPLAEEINSMITLENSQTANFVTYNVYIR